MSSTSPVDQVNLPQAEITNSVEKVNQSSVTAEAKVNSEATSKFASISNFFAKVGSFAMNHKVLVISSAIACSLAIVDVVIGIAAGVVIIGASGAMYAFNLFTKHKNKAEAEPAQPQAEAAQPQAEAQPEAEVEAQPQPQAEAEPEAEVEAQPQPQAEAAQPQAEAEPEAAEAEAQPEAQSEPEVEAKPEVQNNDDIGFRPSQSALDRFFYYKALSGVHEKISEAQEQAVTLPQNDIDNKNEQLSKPLSQEKLQEGEEQEAVLTETKPEEEQKKVSLEQTITQAQVDQINEFLSSSSSDEEDDISDADLQEEEKGKIIENANVPPLPFIEDVE